MITRHFNLYQNQQAYLFENLLRFMMILMIYDNFKIRNRIKNLLKRKLANLNTKRIVTFIFIYTQRNLLNNFVMQKIKNKFKRLKSQ